MNHGTWHRTASDCTLLWQPQTVPLYCILLWKPQTVPFYDSLKPCRFMNHGTWHQTASNCTLRGSNPTEQTTCRSSARFKAYSAAARAAMDCERSRSHYTNLFSSQVGRLHERCIVRMDYDCTYCTTHPKAYVFTFPYMMCVPWHCESWLTLQAKRVQTSSQHACEGVNASSCDT
jgi:hypothetical protein